MKKILIVRLGALGDLIHTVPVVAALRKALPQVRIDWVVDMRHRELLDMLPIVDRRFAVNTGSLGSLMDAVRSLRRERYDVALDLQGLIKSAVLARLSGATRVIGFPRPLLREGAASIFYTETAGAAAGHVIYKNLSMLKALDIPHNTVEFPFEAPSPEIARVVRERLGVGAGDPFALINPGAAWPNKRWPPVYFAEVAVAIKKKYGLPSIVMWGPGEEQLAQDVVDAAQGAAAVSPRTTLGELLSLTGAATVMISGDTGPLHVAGAMGTPLVGLFGPTDPDRNGPWMSRDLTISRFEGCRCHYQRKCHEAHWCLLDISPRDVVELVSERMSELPAR